MQETLKTLREQNKKTLQEVASMLNISVSAAGHYENGRRCIKIEQVLILAKLYNVSAEEIIEAQLQSILVGKSK